MKNPIHIVGTGVDLDSGEPLIATTAAAAALQQNTGNSSRGLKVDGHPAGSRWLRRPALPCFEHHANQNMTHEPQAQRLTHLGAVDLRAAVSSARRIASVAGRERVLIQGGVGAQKLGHVQLKRALVCSFQYIPTS